jgi:hypothetical protein
MPAANTTAVNTGLSKIPKSGKLVSTYISTPTRAKMLAKRLSFLVLRFASKVSNK